jgi:hypothetical protein
MGGCKSGYKNSKDTQQRGRNSYDVDHESAEHNS